jgi:flagellar biosynthesis/type III secretory pathway protein FliH
MGKPVIAGAVYDAQREAAELKQRAVEATEAIRERAHAEGYAAGKALAAQQLFDLASLRVELTQRTERDATQAALLVAGQLLGSALEADPERIADLLRPHLSRMRSAQRLVVRLHPDDASWLEQHPAVLAELRAKHTLAGTLEVRGDASLTRGGCIVESNIGELDARVETRLKLLAAALNLPELVPPGAAEPETEAPL